MHPLANHGVFASAICLRIPVWVTAWHVAAWFSQKSTRAFWNDAAFLLRDVLVMCVSPWRFVHLLRNKSHQVNPWKFRRKVILPASPLVAAMAHFVVSFVDFVFVFLNFLDALKLLEVLSPTSFFWHVFCIILEVCGSGSL